MLNQTPREINAGQALAGAIEGFFGET